jgi:hypothetical protein
LRPAAAVWLIALAACKLGGGFDDARFRCSDTSPCPAGRVCLAGYCELEVPPDAAPPEPAVLGDVVMFTFDDAGLQSFRDRSGHRFDCSGGGADVDTGVFGGAAYLQPSNYLSIPDQPELHLGDHVTIETWLYRDRSGELDPILGDLTIDPGDVAAEYSLEVGSDDRLRFVTNDACVAGAGVSAKSDADRPVPAGDWVHVAAAWDGAEVRFYLGGEPAGAEPLEASPCELERSLRIGRQQGSSDLMTMIGRVDELKLSSIAKSEADIRASMDFDSTGLVNRCGDRIVEAEACDGDGLCCEPAACTATDDGAPCDDQATEGSCRVGVCDLPAARPVDGLVALYELDEGTGTTVVDTSGVPPQLDLKIADAGAVAWGADYLDIQSDTIVASAAGAGKIHSQCAASGELTVDAWVEPASANQAGQIVAMGDGSSSELALAQYNQGWAGRVRSTLTSSRGTPQVPSAIGDVSTRLTHLVLRRDSSGRRTLFVDGRERGVNMAPGSLQPWSDHRLALGDEVGGNDPWAGRIYRVAIYCRALTDREVAASYAAGP